VVELVDTVDSKSIAHGVRVRVSTCAPKNHYRGGLGRGVMSPIVSRDYTGSIPVGHPYDDFAELAESV
jgi:hypothetical protein